MQAMNAKPKTLIVPENLRGPLVLRRVKTLRQWVRLLKRAPWALFAADGREVWMLEEAK
jgi:hypothetical protein